MIENSTAELPARLRVGVDSGGTFTDVCMFDETTGRIHVWKVSSTPSDPSLGIAAGVAQGIAEVSRQTGQTTEVMYFGHGTTVATNALITGRGSDVGLITTAGFRDVLELRRQKRDSLYDPQTRKPAILAKRDKRLEVKERVCFDGSIATPLDEDDVRAACRKLKAAGIRTVAISFLFSFLAPEHEARAKAIVAEELPDAFISVSHEVAPEFREYERTSTTVVNAYLGPVMEFYLGRLSPRLTELGVNAPPRLTQSNGGVISADMARQFPARTVLSGPAAGVAGAVALGAHSGAPNMITFDMGGTSTDVALIENGRPSVANDTTVHGYPLKLPMLDIHTVGAGGGSIAFIDSGGLLKVGPRSAGADPGPVCYGLGNEVPTVTDADVVLQVLNPTHLLAGRMPIDQARAKAAIARLADRLGLDVMATAQGIISVVVANMAKAIRVISVERGYDPRDFAMLAFGGAGPVHAARLARELDIPRLLVPRNPGIMCALGLLLTDLRTSMSLTRARLLAEASAADFDNGFAQLEAAGHAWFVQEGITPERQHLLRSLDMRYGGQAFELTVPCPPGPIGAAALRLLRERFEAAHQQAYGYISAEAPIQVTTLRLEAVGQVNKARLDPYPSATEPVEASRIGSRPVWLPEAGAFVDCPIYDRDRLRPGHAVSGPAIVEQMDSTTLVLPEQTATVDPHLTLIIEG